MEIIIPVVVLLVLAGAALFVVGGNKGSTGFLSRETRKSDAGKAASTAGQDESTDDARARADETAAKAESAVPSPLADSSPAMTEEELGISRRHFMNVGIIGSVAAATGAFGAGAIAFLYPSASGGFGGDVDTGTRVKDILDGINEDKEPAYFPEARAYVSPYPKDKVGDAESVGYNPNIAKDNLAEGFVVQYQKCPHLGCRVPWCDTSQWFECPCHGSKFNQAGEKQDGPAPRGMTLFLGKVSGSGALTIDTSVEIEGLPIGTDTTGQAPEGPACV